MNEFYINGYNIRGQEQNLIFDNITHYQHTLTKAHQIIQQINGARG